MKPFCAIILIGSMIFQHACFAQVNSDVPPLSQDNWLRAASDFSIYEKLSLLELDIMGKSNPRRKIDERLINLERNVFGKDYVNQSADLFSRLVALFQSAKPPDSLVQHLAEESLKIPDWSYRTATPPWLNTAFQTVAGLEIELTGKICPAISLVDRINSLRKNALNKDEHTDPQGIFEKIEELQTIVQPSSESISKAQHQLNNTGYFHSPSGMPTFGSLGGGIKNSGKRITEPTKSVLKSPTFWLALLGAGAVAGLYVIGRNAGNNSNNLTVGENGCTGSLSCNHCKNCRYCQWCNEGGKPCGVHVMLYGR